MRNNIVHSGADKLTYEIRSIVAVAKKFEDAGLKIYWENIGDPVAKGEEVPEWIREIVSKTALESSKSYAYSPTKGILATREFLAEARNSKGGAKITPEDILFFNGLGDAISRVYANLNGNVRVIGPDPAYSTHSSAEASHASSPHITYKLDPANGWYPNLDDLRRQVAENPAISGILIINPDNPTGMVYPRHILEGMVRIAKQFGLFIISDEIYSNLVYEGTMTDLGDVIGDVPGIALKGLSKEVPWPGARCGWAEFYNTEKDPVFAAYIKSIVDAKMLEVCSTTLPQMVLPKIFSDPRYIPYRKEKNKHYKERADIACSILSKVPGIMVNKPGGAFYLTIVFKEGILKPAQALEVTDPLLKKEVERITAGASLDKRFVYYLLAATGICTVPLSGFNSSLPGIRITLLESDQALFIDIFTRLAEAIERYLGS